MDTETPQSNGGGCMSDGWILDIDARLTADEKLSAASGAAVNGAAGSTRALAWESTGSLRWQAAADMTAESGSNAGSSFSFAAHSDAGALIGVVDTIARASRVLDFKLNPTVNGLLAGALPNRQIFTASGTWTKPADYPDDTPVLIECWGGGGIQSAGNGNAGGRPSNVERRQLRQSLRRRAGGLGRFPQVHHHHQRPRLVGLRRRREQPAGRNLLTWRQWRHRGNQQRGALSGGGGRAQPGARGEVRVTVLA